MIKNKLYIVNTFVYAVLTIGLLICSGVLTKASAQLKFNPIPDGSYRRTCVYIVTKDFSPPYVKGADLYAACAPKSSITAMTTSRLQDVFECDGDISNNDGQLKCSRNQNSVLMQSAKKALNGVYTTILGGDLSEIPYQSGYKIYLREIFNAGFGAEFYAGTLGSQANVQTVSTVFFNYLNASNHADIKAKIIDSAFNDVYGVGVSPKDLAFYNAKKIAYADVVEAESKKLIADKVIHRISINWAYMKAMGRPANPADFDYWTSKPQTYKQIVDANRNFLYSSKGAGDLTETVKRHLADKGNYNPSVSDINQAIIKFSPKKLIYEEMK